MVKWNKSEQQQGVTEITGSQSSGRDKRNKINLKVDQVDRATAGYKKRIKH